MQPHRSICFQRADVIPPMDSPNAALCTLMNELSFYKTVEKNQSDMPQPSLEVVLNEEATIVPGYSKTGAGGDVIENLRRNPEECLEDRRIGKEARAP